RLIEFTAMHFSCEESLLERHGYPEIESHRAEHRRLMGEIRGAQDLTQHAAASDLQPLLDILRGWFIDHVEKLDRRYGAWLNTHGIY
ncbi:MAG TPA: hemerythrin domain-containing protein, partial [Terracidiphilus sp.]|nr:hemerythrin domain-containing protein [Terracidiphilus sp.]